MLKSSKFDGNGDKEKIRNTITTSLTDVDLTIYDYEQKSRDEMWKEQYEKEMAVKKIDRVKYYEMVRDRKEKERKIKELNGRTKW